MSQFAYRIDLRDISGEGTFPCPQCWSNISPEDETNKNYSILRIHSENDNLKEVIVICKKCEGTIHIVGFSSGIYKI